MSSPRIEMSNRFLRPRESNEYHPKLTLRTLHVSGSAFMATCYFCLLSITWLLLITSYQSCMMNSSKDLKLKRLAAPVLARMVHRGCVSRQVVTEWYSLSQYTEGQNSAGWGAEISNPTPLPMRSLGSAKCDLYLSLWVLRPGEGKGNQQRAD